MTDFRVDMNASKICRILREFLEWKIRSQHCAWLEGVHATLCALIIQQVREETSLC